MVRRHQRTGVLGETKANDCNAYVFTVDGQAVTDSPNVVGFDHDWDQVDLGDLALICAWQLDVRWNLDKFQQALSQSNGSVTSAAFTWTDNVQQLRGHDSEPFVDPHELFDNAVWGSCVADVMPPSVDPRGRSGLQGVSSTPQLVRTGPTSYDVTSLVQQWAASPDYANWGVLLRGYDEDQNAQNKAACVSRVTNLALVIHYAVPDPTPVPNPFTDIGGQCVLVNCPHVVPGQLLAATPTPAPPTPVPPTPVPTPAPTVDPAQAATIRSPQPDQTMHDVLIDVTGAQQGSKSSVFDLQWSYLSAGSWFVMSPTGPLDQIDKGNFPNGVTLPNALFTGFQCGSAASPCAFRVWRVRARVHGKGDQFWSDWTQFKVQ